MSTQTLNFAGQLRFAEQEKPLNAEVKVFLWQVLTMWDWLALTRDRPAN